MKLGTVESLKFKKLKMRLGLAQWQAIGLLESLWMFTARNAPLGDIGKHSNEDIAVHLEWTGNPDSLIDELIDCRWLDRSDEHRLLIHDWADHLPMWLQGNLTRHQKKPISTKQPAKQATKQPAIEESKVTCYEHPAIFSSDLISSDSKHVAPLFGENGIQKPEGDYLTFKTPPSDRANQFFLAYPVKTHKGQIDAALEAQIAHVAEIRGLTEDAAFQWILSRAMEYAKSPAGRSPPSGGDWRPNPAKWLADQRFDDGIDAWMKPNGDAPRNVSQKPKMKPLGANQ